MRGRRIPLTGGFVFVYSGVLCHKRARGGAASERSSARIVTRAAGSVVAVRRT